MLIHRLHLHNFCQHRDLEITLTPGLNMLVGPNGSGKTNVLRAIQLVLIGDAGGDRNKADDICQWHRNGEEASVEAWMSHSNAEIYVRRGLNMSNLLTIGEERWTAVGEINAELWRRLGATKKQITDYIFVRQRKVDEMFDQRPADRAASLAALFGVEHAEKVHKQLGEFLHNIEVPTTTLNEDVLRGQLAEHGTDIVAIDGDIRALNMPTDPAACLHEQQTIITQFQGLLAVERRIHALKSQLDQKEAAIGAVVAPLRELDEGIAELRAGLDAIADDCTASRVGLEQWKAYYASEAMRQALATDTATFDVKWGNLVVPEQPADEELTEAELTALDGLKNRRAEIHISLRDIKKAGDTCTACGQKLPNAARNAERKSQLENELTTIDARTPPLQARRDAWISYREASKTHESGIQQRQIESKQLNARLEALKSFKPPALSEAELQEPLMEHASFTGAMQRLQAKKTDEALKLSELEGEAKQLTLGLVAEQATKQRLPRYTQQQHDAATACVHATLVKQRALEQLQRRRAVTDAKRAAAETQLKDVQAVKAQGRRTREVVQHLTEVRTVFHRSEAPRMVAYTYVEQMLGEINAALELFEAPFRVEMDESLGFTARFLDGVRVQPDRRLSVGERIVLAMAFRITVNATFAGQVGVLIMDEPTAGLDEHNLGCLPRALDRLRDLSHERGLQVLFVTHESRISHHFDNAIELPIV